MPPAALADVIHIAPFDVWVPLLLVWVFLTGSTIVGYVHPALRGPRGLRVRQAITSWWPVSIVAALGSLLGPTFTLLVFSVVGVLLGTEMLRLLQLPLAQRREHRIVVAGFVVAGIAAAVADVDIAALVVAPMLVVPVVQLVRFGPAGFARAVPGVTWAVVVAGVLWSFVARIVVHGHGPYGGPGAACVFFILVMLADAMQYVVGKLCGRTKLAPITSPNKTVEGLIGGIVIVAAVGAALVPAMLGRPAWQGAIVGVIVVVTGLVGDLVMSAFKRDVGAKDTGDVLPGQGGALDRCDSIVVCAPLFWWWLTS